MSNYIVRTPTLFEDFETFGDWSVSNGTAVLDPNVVHSGNSSMQCTTGVGTSCFILKTINADLSKIGTTLFWVYLKDVSVVQKVRFVISSSTTLAKYFSYQINGGNLRSGWNCISIAMNDWTNNSSDDWANTMVRMRCELYANASSTAIGNFDSMYINFYSRPKIMFHFDDNFDTVYYQAYSYMSKYNMRGTIFAVHKFSDTSTYMTSAQIQECYNAGWDVCNHSYTHPDFTSLVDRAAAEAEISQNREWLASKGWTRNNSHYYFCYPAGFYDSKTLDAVASQNTIVARSTIERLQPPFIDSQYLLTEHNLGYQQTLATIEGYVDQAISQGVTVIFTIHKILSVPTTGTEWAISDFQALVDYIASKSSQIDVMTLPEWYMGLSNPRRLV